MLEWPVADQHGGSESNPNDPDTPWFPAHAPFNARDRPTHSVYGGPWFDVLCVAANYHCEHHDFPKVPLWKLPELKRRAGAEFYPASPPWYDVLRGAFSTKVTYPRWERVV